MRETSEKHKVETTNQTNKPTDTVINDISEEEHSLPTFVVIVTMREGEEEKQCATCVVISMRSTTIESTTILDMDAPKNSFLSPHILEKNCRSTVEMRISLRRIG